MSRTFRIFTASPALLLLTACSLANGGGPPADVAHYCLAMPAGSGVGWSDLDVPISSLLQTMQKPGAHQTWEKSAAGGYIYHITGTDPLTHKTHEIGFEFSDAGLQQAQTCGPRRLGVARMLADGQELTGWDLINMIPSLITAPPQAASSSPVPQTSPPVQPPVATPQLASSDPNFRQFPANDTETSAPTISNQAEGDSGAILSPTYRSCMSSGDAAEGVTVALLNCAAAETNRQDARLNQAYKGKMAASAPDQQQALRTSERDWIKNRDATCKDAASVEAGGSLAGVIYAQCIVKQEAARADVLERSR